MFSARLHERFWPPLLGLLTFASAASAGLSPSADGDIWWHLAAGREMVARGTLLSTDPFSLSAAGRPWIDVHWLFQLAVFALYQRGGLLGLVLAKCALLGVGGVLLSRALPGGGSWARPLFATLLFLALIAVRSSLLVRPVIATLVLLALYLLLLGRFRRGGHVRDLLPLPFLQVLWANIQGLSALGPALIAAYAVAGTVAASCGERYAFAPEHARGLSPLRHAASLAIAMLLSLLACCLTPFGQRGALFPSLLLGRLLPTAENVFSRSVAENVPPFALEQSSGEFWHFKWMLLLFALTTLLAGRRVRLSQLLVLAGFSGLALIANRNVLLCYWVATPIAALHAAPRLRALAARFRTGGQRALRLANAAAFLALSTVSARAFAGESSLREPCPFRAPAESVRLLARLPPGDVFTADHQGGYLIWQLYPRFKPYIDTRLVLRSAAEYTEYLGLADYPERFAAFQARNQFRYVILPVDFPERYQRLIAELHASPEWKLLFTDGSEVLFGRTDETPEIAPLDLRAEATTNQILAALAARYEQSPKLYDAARLHLATLDLLIKDFAQAERVLANIHTPAARALEARARFAAGDLDAARRMAQACLARDRRDVASLNLLALVALRRGELLSGIQLLRRALDIAPFDSEATEILAHFQESER